MTTRRLIEIWNLTMAIIALVISTALLSAGCYLFWMLIKALHKYLAN